LLSANETITLRQFQILFILEAFGTGFIVLPRRAADYAGQDGWILALLLLVPGLIFTTLVGGIAGKFGSETFVSYTRRLLTSPIAFVLSMALWAKIIFCAGLELRLFGWIIRDLLLFRTPSVAVYITLLCVAAYAAYKGIETRARMAEILMMIIFLPFIALGIIALFNLDLSNLMPVMVTPPQDIALGLFRLGFMFTGLEFFFLAFPYLNKPREGRKVAMSAMIFVVALMTLITVAALAKFTAENTQAQPWPVLQMMDMLNIPGSIIERQSALILSFWMLSVFAFLSASLFYSAVLAREWGKQIRHGYWVVVCGIIVLCVALLPLSREQVFQLLDWVVLGFGLVFWVGLPILLWFITWLQKKMQRGQKMLASTAISLAMVAIFLTGCWDRVELEDRAFAIAIGLDRFDNEDRNEDKNNSHDEKNEAKDEENEKDNHDETKNAEVAKESNDEDDDSSNDNKTEEATDTDKPNELNKTTDKPSELNKATDKPSELNKTTDKPSELNKTTDTNNTDKTDEKHDKHDNKRKKEITDKKDEKEDKNGYFSFFVAAPTGIAEDSPGGDAMGYSDESDDSDKDKNEANQAANGRTIVEAIKALNSHSSRHLFLGHAKTVVIGKEILEDGKLFQEALSSLEQLPEIDRQIGILVTPSNVPEILAAKPPGESKPGYYVIHFNRLAEKSGGMSFHADLETVYSQLRATGTALIPSIREEDGHFLLQGAMAVKGNQLAGELDAYETRGLLWAKDKKCKGAVVTIEHEERPISMVVRRHSATPHFSEEDGRLHCTIDVRITGETSFPLDRATLQELVQEYEAHIEEEMQQVIKKLQQEWEIDAYNFKSNLRKRQYQLYQRYADYWDEAFLEMEIVPSVKCKLEEG